LVPSRERHRILIEEQLRQRLGRRTHPEDHAEVSSVVASAIPSACDRGIRGHVVTIAERPGEDWTICDGILATQVSDPIAIDLNTDRVSVVAVLGLRNQGGDMIPDARSVGGLASRHDRERILIGMLADDVQEGVRALGIEEPSVHLVVLGRGGSIEQSTQEPHGSSLHDACRRHITVDAQSRPS
jgi:hypothetical protein